MSSNSPDSAATPDRPHDMRALADIMAERLRQIDKEGWSRSHDDKHDAGELPRAAACYAIAALDHFSVPDIERLLWPWSSACWKPRDARANLVRAGALILAEIERLDREASTPETYCRGSAPISTSGKVCRLDPERSRRWTP